MLTLDQLKDVLFKQSVFINLVHGHNWARLHTSLEDGVITISVFSIDNWVPIYRLSKTSDRPLLDSPVYESEDCVVGGYYKNMTDLFIKYLIGLTSHLEQPIRVEVWSYCKYCNKKITSYSSLARGFGSECNKHYKENK